MDMSRSVKRLLLIAVLAIFVILLSKSLLGTAVKNLGVEAERIQQAKAAKIHPTALPESAAEVTAAGADASSNTLANEPGSAPVASGNTDAAQQLSN